MLMLLTLFSLACLFGSIKQEGKKTGAVQALSVAHRQGDLERWAGYAFLPLKESIYFFTEIFFFQLKEKNFFN
jgi:hypothetical protein